MNVTNSTDNSFRIKVHNMLEYITAISQTLEACHYI